MSTSVSSLISRRTVRLLSLAVGVVASTNVWAIDSTIGESSSHEIQFCSGVAAPYATCSAVDLRNKADALGTTVAIYEYVRNNYDYALYHGARSGAINTYLGGRGNDVDLAATLIAMLRSQGTPARFVVGTVRAPAAQVMNWLSVKNPELAKGLLRDQGIQNVVLAADNSTLDFEHVWVEALVPYANYRGAGPKTIDCVTSPSQCNWVPLDPSFKQRGQRVSGLDPFATLNFDYTSYYNALKNNDTARRDKNPLEIYQEQVLSWLQTNAPGKTLQDIPDFTDIIAETDGLLPASLPFATVGSVRRYNSAADHDVAFPATEPKKWMKYVTVIPFFRQTLPDGTINTAELGIKEPISLVDASTQRLTLSYDASNGSIRQNIRLGSTVIGGFVADATMILGGGPVAVGFRHSLEVQMDGAPAPDSNGTDQTIQATYDAIVGGYYLILTGGETSNWSQVHRAAQQLLAANQQYKIAFNPGEGGCDTVTGMNCTPYLDANSNGWDASDARLLDSTTALDALTGGMLYVAGTQYYAAFRDKLGQLDAINKIRSPISGFLGVVSTTYDVEYIDGTAFSILPGGLLIDMKGLRFNGTWRIDQAADFSNKQFELIGHISSSLEHETWQQLTGYDAISTVRGIQMALFNGASLVNPIKNAGTDTTATMYPSFNYATTAPAGFTRNVRTLFNTNYLSWSNGNSSAIFVALRPNVQGYASSDPNLVTWTYFSSDGNDNFLADYDSVENQLIALISTNPSGSYVMTCSASATQYTGTPAVLLGNLQGCFNSDVALYGLSSYFSFFDPTASLYFRAVPAANDDQLTSKVVGMRNDLYLRDQSQYWIDYLIPSKLSVGPTYRFGVDLRRTHETASGKVVSATYEIVNDQGISAGGGYVVPVNPAGPLSKLPVPEKDKE